MQERQNLSTPARPVRRGLMGFPSMPVEKPEEKWCTGIESAIESPCTAYLHIPFCRSRCTFCNFYSGTGTKQEIADYAQLLIREIRDWGPRIRGTVNAVYFGGGSPGILAPGDVRSILSAVRSALPLANDAEITWETRVEDLDDAHLDATLENGVNRFSAGVQTFHTGLRRSLGRASAKEVILEALQRTMNYNQAAVTVDLLYGLPGQTPEQLTEDLDAVCRAGISGFSFYRFHVHPGLRLAEQIRAGQMPQIPPEEACFELYRLCTERMAAAGANKISFKHYAFGTRERNLYNAISAWKLPCIPFGLGAAGRLGEFRFKQTSSRSGSARRKTDCRGRTDARRFPGVRPHRRRTQLLYDSPSGVRASVRAGTAAGTRSGTAQGGGGNAGRKRNDVPRTVRRIPSDGTRMFRLSGDRIGNHGKIRGSVENVK